MKNFYESLRVHAMEMINFERKKNEVINKWQMNSRTHIKT